MEGLRTVFFLGVMTGILLLIGGLVGGMDGVWVAFGFAVLMNGFSYFFSDKIVLFMYRAKPLDQKMEQGHRVKTIVKRVCDLMRIPMPILYTIDNPSPNAFATGRNPKHAAVVFTHGILSLLNDSELEGVVAHELSHVKNRDILIASIAATIAGAIGTIAWWLQWGAIGNMGGRNSEGRNPIGLLVIAISIPIITLLVRLAISRGREFLADETAAKTLHSGKGLASALSKLEKGIHAVPFAHANEGTAHLFISNPFGRIGVLGLFSTHPDTQERIKRLEKY